MIDIIGSSRLPCNVKEQDGWTCLPYPTKYTAGHTAFVTAPHGDRHRIYAIVGRPWYICQFIDVGEVEVEWTFVKAKLAVTRVHTCAVLLDHTTIVVCGGMGLDDKATAECEQLDLITHTFSPFPAMTKPRCWHSGVHYDGTIVIICGSDMDLEGGTQTCEQYSPAIDKWIPFATPALCDYKLHAAVVDTKIYIVAINGMSEVYDGSAWNMIENTCPLRSHIAAIVPFRGRLILMETHWVGYVHAFDPKLHSWTDYKNSFTINILCDFPFVAISC